MASFSANRGSSSSGRRPELPAFCRTRRSGTHLVSVNSLRGLYRLLLLVLALQLSTLLLVIAGPVPAQFKKKTGLLPFPEEATSRAARVPFAEQLRPER
jgi:hypothetical protein